MVVLGADLAYVPAIMRTRSVLRQIWISPSHLLSAMPISHLAANFEPSTHSRERSISWARLKSALIFKV